MRVCMIVLIYACHVHSSMDVFMNVIDLGGRGGGGGEGGYFHLFQYLILIIIIICEVIEIHYQLK